MEYNIYTESLNGLSYCLDFSPSYACVKLGDECPLNNHGMTHYYYSDRNYSHNEK